MEIERVGPGDWETVREIRLAALEDSPHSFWAAYDEEVDEPESWWREFVGSGAWFVAFEDEAPVGLVAAIPDRYLDESERQLISMWVAPEVRKRGVGRALVERVKEWARTADVTDLRLDVTDGNSSALRLYLGIGFRLTGRTTPHPRDERLMENEMRLRL